MPLRSLFGEKTSTCNLILSKSEGLLIILFPLSSQARLSFSAIGMKQLIGRITILREEVGMVDNKVVSTLISVARFAASY